MYANTYVALVNHPFFPSMTDSKFDFVTRAKNDPNNIVVPLLDNHDMEKPAIGTCTLVYVPVFETKEGRNLCLVIGNIATDRVLKGNQHVSMSAGIAYQKADTNFYDEIIEVSIVDKAHVPLCHIYPSETLKGFIHRLSENTQFTALFSKQLKKIGEL